MLELHNSMYVLMVNNPFVVNIDYVKTVGGYVGTNDCF